MAWRPPYQPQLLHTTWGTLARPHCGHRLRAGASSFQADARRLRVLALLVFFLGTAMCLALCFRLLAELAEGGPSRIHGVDRVAAIDGVSVGPTLGTQTLTIRFAKRCRG